MITITYKDIADRTETRIPEHLVAGAEPPHFDWADGVATRQGDVLIQPWGGAPLTGQQVPLTGRGHKVVAGEADRNSHILNGDGYFVEGSVVNDLDYGLLTVPAGGLTVVTHTDEHGSMTFGPGVWRLWGQLDAATRRRVAD